jgi:hypothetical protein
MLIEATEGLAMSIFGNIMSAIFGSKPAGTSSAASSTAASGSATPPASSAPAAGSPTSAASVDVEAVMNELASKNKEKLNWRTSIVDLMKLLKLDSSLASRKELAKELGYKDSTDDSAAMNIWLHKQVMKKLAENGGRVPADLH